MLVAAQAIDANSAPILIFDTDACAASFFQSDRDAYAALFRHANAQGITVLASRRRPLRSLLPVLFAAALTINLGCGDQNSIITSPVKQTDPGSPLGR